MNNPKGKLVIIGGALDKGDPAESKKQAQNLNYYQLAIIRRIASEAKGKDSKVCVIPTASRIPKITAHDFAKAFSLIDVNNIHVLNIRKREHANDKKIIAPLKDADIVIFSGGDQLRLTSILGGTKFMELLMKRYLEDDIVVAGTSAGAAASSNTMIYQGSPHEAMHKGEIKLTGGLGFIDGVIIDTHFVKRGRIGRLFQSVTSNPGMLGIGLGEDTGLLVTGNTKMEALGSGLVILVDGSEIKDTNITSVPVGTPISAQNLIVHVLSLGDAYNLKTKNLLISKTKKIIHNSTP